MWRLIAFLGALAAARADCVACLGNRCHSKKIVLQGFRITDQLAIDRIQNLLYTQLDHHTTAIFLDESRIQSVHSVNTTGLAVDQETQLLYTSVEGVVYSHKYEKNRYETKIAFALDNSTSTRLRYEDTLYTINEDGSVAYFSKIYKVFAGSDNLENFKVTDMVNVKYITHWYFVSNDRLYKFIWKNGKLSWYLISDKKHVLSIGRNGDVYFGDASDKVIYKLNRETQELDKYGSYLTGSVEDFVFDKDENIVFRDEDGSVARWMPSEEICSGPHSVASLGDPDSDEVDFDLTSTKSSLSEMKKNRPMTLISDE